MRNERNEKANTRLNRDKSNIFKATIVNPKNGDVDIDSGFMDATGEKF